MDLTVSKKKILGGVHLRFVHSQNKASCSALSVVKV